MTAINSCYDIENAVKKTIEAGNNPRMMFKSVDIQKDLSAITHPSFAVSVTGATCEPMNSGRITQNFDLVVTIAAKNLASEEQRRKVLHPLACYVIQKLNDNSLGLDMEPLTVSGWNDVTQDSFLALALTVFEVKFTGSYELETATSEKTYRRLESILSTFVEGNDELLQGEVNLTSGENHEN